MAGSACGWRRLFSGEQPSVLERVAQHLGHVQVRTGRALLLGEAAEVHEAAHVDADTRISGLAARRCSSFRSAHRLGDVGKPHGKRAAEAAALLGLAELDQVHARDRPHQRGRRLGAARAAGVAGAVEGDGRVEPPGPGRHPEAVDDEIRQLPRAPAELLHRGQVGLVLELQQRAVKEHRGARARRHDHRVSSPVKVRTVWRTTRREAGQSPRVERRLAAAGLRLGKLDRAAEVFEHLDGRDGDVVVKGVAQARGHQLDLLPEQRLALNRHHCAKEAGCRIRSAPQSRFLRENGGPFPLSPDAPDFQQRPCGLGQTAIAPAGEL